MRSTELTPFGLPTQPREETWDDLEMALAPDVACEEVRLMLDWDSEEVEVDAQATREHMPECSCCQRLYKAVVENGSGENVEGLLEDLACSEEAMSRVEAMDETARFLVVRTHLEAPEDQRPRIIPYGNAN